MHVILIIVLFGFSTMAEASTHPLYQKQTTLAKFKDTLKAYKDAISGRKLRNRSDHLPGCYEGAYDEWGEQEIAAKWTKGYCSSVLEFGGGGGSVSTVIQKI